MDNPYAAQTTIGERRSNRVFVYAFLTAWSLLTILAFVWTGIYPLYVNYGAPSPDQLKTIDRVLAPLR